MLSLGFRAIQGTNVPPYVTEQGWLAGTFGQPQDFGGDQDLEFDQRSGEAEGCAREDALLAPPLTALSRSTLPLL